MGTSPPTFGLSQASQSNRPHWTVLATTLRRPARGSSITFFWTTGGFPRHRFGGQVRRETAAGREGTGPEICPISELSVRNPFQRQPALLLGLGAWQSLYHYVISHTRVGLRDYGKVKPNPKSLIDESIQEDYIVLTQRPNYASEAAWKKRGRAARVHTFQPPAVFAPLPTQCDPIVAAGGEGRQ